MISDAVPVGHWHVIATRMTESLDRRERRELCDLFDQLGPGAPTMCEGWTNFDLAAHLVVRERSLRGAPGILLGDKVAALARQTTAAEGRERAKGFPAVVQLVRSGPPLATRFVSKWLNLNEFAIHHEDVRRANALGPRTDRLDLQDGLWASYKTMARFTPGLPKDVTLELTRSAGDTITVGKHGPTVIVAGEPLELGLFLFGRRSVAKVELSGDHAAVAKLKSSKL